MVTRSKPLSDLLADDVCDYLLREEMLNEAPPPRRARSASNNNNGKRRPNASSLIVQSTNTNTTMPPKSRKGRQHSDLSKVSKVSFADEVHDYILEEKREVFQPHPLNPLSFDHSSDSGGSMQIDVDTLDGKNVAPDVEPFDTIDYVKMKIQENVGISSHQQRLVLLASNQQLDLDESGRKLGDYGIQNESTIQLQPLLQDPKPMEPEKLDDESLDQLSKLVADHIRNSDEVYYKFDPESGTVLPDTYLDIPESRDDAISVMTFETSFTSSSVISETNSESCLPDNLQDDTSILTPKTANHSAKHPHPRGNSGSHSPARKIQPGEKDHQASSRVSSREPLAFSSQEVAGQEQPLKNWSSQISTLTSPGLATPTTQNDEPQHLPPIPPPAVQNVEEDTLYTAVAEAQVSADCSITLTTNERSLFIKQGRCPTCGLQTHKLSGIFKKRSIRPLSNEHVLSGRCLICNPINIITHQMVDSNASQHDALPVQLDGQVLNGDAQVEKSAETNPIGHPRTPQSVSSLRTSSGSKTTEVTPILKDPAPSAPSLDHFCSESEAEDIEPTFNYGPAKHVSKTAPRNEVEQWLLSHLPSLKEQDIKKYCSCLDEDGFDSIFMLAVLEEEDLSFMKKAHRRVLTKMLRSKSRFDPPSFED